MTRSTFLGAATLVALVTACSNEPTAETPVNQLPAVGPGPAGVAATAPPQDVEQGTERMPFDQSFIDAMITHHKRAEDAAKIALDRGEHPEIKAMASEMITTDDAEIAKMKELRRTWYGVPGAPASVLPNDEKSELPGTSTTKDMSKDLGTLKTAEPFDLAFIDAMIPHHEGAVAMAKAASEKAQQPETRALAVIIVRDEEKAIAQMRAWRDTWYPTAQAMREPAAP